MKTSFAAATLLLALCIIASGASAQENASFTLSLTGLSPAGANYRYEGWIVVNGSPLTTGVFDVATDGSYMGEVSLEATLVANATAFVLTLEPFPDADPSPSATKVFSGMVDPTASGAQAISAAGAAALNNDFSSAAGVYFLAIPSAAAGSTANYTSGIWFGTPGMPPTTGLTLPTLPAGWQYEGWVVPAGGPPMTTGRFTNASTMDSDGAGATGGPNPGPAVPGQDFLNPVRSLIGYTAVISIEPEPDNSPDPYAFKPLVDMNIEDVGAAVAQSMSPNLDSFGSGSVTFNSAASPAVRVEVGTIGLLLGAAVLVIAQRY